MKDAKTLRIVAAVALVLSAGLFAFGVAREHSSAEAPNESVATVTPAESPSAEVTGGETGTSGGETTGTTTESRAGSDATLLGINLESKPFLAAALIVSIALALGLVIGRSRLLLVATVVVAGTFAIADLREVFHQLHEHPGLAAIATLVALLHVAAVIAVVGTLRRPRPVEAPA